MDHDGPRLWPWPDDLDVDLNDRPGPGRLDETARRVRTRLRRAALPEVVGHGDFESQNIRWNGDELHGVHDWDSAVARPEAALAGLAAAVFPAGGPENRPATVAETERFLAGYARARGRRWTREESPRWPGPRGCGCWPSTPRRHRPPGRTTPPPPGAVCATTRPRSTR
ncbi:MULTISPECIES: phosphotransferase [Streptomyces]|uniref:Aminoglycoside phosphotransferase domain-containing protein n=1 Tax=Streptomyces prasinus TaxID=67345 RepID=A0ABX6APP6_9ACTN|nr:phosphotransferase [Streptomyces prasinus]QEV04698.1 hypothetical protein CP972_02275 [Streptomyces prasinus]